MECMGGPINVVLITLICKANKKDTKGGWWRITLLNVFYKVLAKVLDNKIKSTIA
jgi:hypothetical protein